MILRKNDGTLVSNVPVTAIASKLLQTFQYTAGCRWHYKVLLVVLMSLMKGTPVYHESREESDDGVGYSRAKKFNLGGTHFMKIHPKHGTTQSLTVHMEESWKLDNGITCDILIESNSKMYPDKLFSPLDSWVKVKEWEGNLKAMTIWSSNASHLYKGIETRSSSKPRTSK